MTSGQMTRVMKLCSEWVLAKMNLGSRGWSPGLEYLVGRRGASWLRDLGTGILGLCI